MGIAEYLKRLDSTRKRLAKEFEKAAYLRAARASVQAVEEYAKANDIDALVIEVGMTQADLTELSEEVRASYVKAGITEASELRHTFDVRNEKAEQWLANKSADLVALATQGQTESLRIVLANGMEHGRGPRSVALDIVGRMNAVTKRREGGIIGLYPEQVRYVANARAEINSLDPKYFTREARDKRFDRLIAKAIKDDKPLKAKQVDAIVSRYSDKLLKVRGDNIGRTEALSAIASGEEQARKQALEDGVVEPEFSYKEWSTSGDGSTRDSHADMDGQRVGINEPFETPDGELLMHPGDTSMGASAKNTINCRCRAVTKIDYIGMQAARER